MLASITGLAGLTRIPVDVEIRQNPALTLLTGFGNLTSIGKDLDILSNATLMNLDALDQLVTVGEDLDIEHNPTLPQDCADELALQLGSGLGGTYTTGDNGSGPCL
jgi:hypothetical protein